MPIEWDDADVRRKLSGFERAYADEVAEALYEEGREVQRESMRRTPVDTGALRASHKTNRPYRRGKTLTVIVQVGGPAAEYAPHVHWRADVKHKVGGSHFLQSAVEEARPGMARRIAERVAKKVEGK